MADPLILQLISQFRGDLLARDATAVAEMVQRWTAVEAQLNEAIEKLVEETAVLAEKGETLSRSKLFQLQRFRSLLSQLLPILNSYRRYAEGVIEAEAEAAQEMGHGHARELLQATMNGRLPSRVATAFDRLPTDAAENIAALARGGGPLRKLSENAYPTAVEGIVNQLITGVSLGRNPRETTRLIKKQGLAQGLNHILLVARDQQIRNYREMARQGYQRSGVVKRYVRIAAKQTRTCAACLALDGTIYETAEIMPLHPQDRCLAPGQLVRTRRGDVPIEDVQVGDEVLTANGRYRRVLARSKRPYRGDMIRITEGDRELLVTPEHKVMTQRGWVEARALREDDTLARL